MDIVIILGFCNVTSLNKIKVYLIYQRNEYECFQDMTNRKQLVEIMRS